MENRRDELEKFAYVFNYKIKELTSQIGPRQHEVNSLIQQFHHVTIFLLNCLSFSHFDCLDGSRISFT
mgnify:CR=1 FL=1